MKKGNNMSEFNREFRYWIFKNSDVMKYLDAEQLETLWTLLDVCNDGRLLDNKLPLTAVVVEADWPEYEEVWRMIEERVGENSCKIDGINAP